MNKTELRQGEFIFKIMLHEFSDDINSYHLISVPVDTCKANLSLRNVTQVVNGISDEDMTVLKELAKLHNQNIQLFEDAEGIISHIAFKDVIIETFSLNEEFEYEIIRKNHNDSNKEDYVETLTSNIDFYPSFLSSKD